MKPIDSENVIAWLNAQIEKVRGGWLHDYGFPTNVIVALTDVKRFVKNLPTIEPEVRHGRWIFKKGDNKSTVDGWVCTSCKSGFHTKVPYFEVFKYCPMCGARMGE